MERKVKLLVVDDTPENISILFDLFKEEYAVVVATSGDAALRLAGIEPRPDVILLDVLMPNMNGYETCGRLKLDPATRDIPVLFITGLSDEANEAKGLDVGAVDFITKPFRPALVKSRVRNQLDLKLHRDHLEELVRQRTEEIDLIKAVTIETLASIVEYRDPETGGHINRTQAYVRIMAEHLSLHAVFSRQLTPDFIDLLHRSAPLHDIGKIVVPDVILLKPGKLTPEEFEEMKKHTTFGHRALQAAEKKLGSSSFFGCASEIAYTHHEKWDGSGYPRGISGKDIPVSGRLMAVADVYDALISRRVYKPPFTHAEAVEIIRQGRGSHFDPQVVDAFLAVHEKFRETAMQYEDHEVDRDQLAHNT